MGVHVALEDWLPGVAVSVVLLCLTRVAILRVARRPDSTEKEQVLSVPWRVRFISFMMQKGVVFFQKEDGQIDRNGLFSFLANDIVPQNENFTKYGVATRDLRLKLEDRSLEARIFLPKSVTLGEKSLQKKKSPIGLFFHGGGFCYSTAKEKVYDVFCRRIASHVGIVIVSVEYRLAPENPFPAAYEDGFEVLSWLKNNGTEDPWISSYADISNCFLLGDSAGGNIAHHVSLRARETDLSPLQIRGRCLICPFFGGTDKLESEIKFANGYICGEKVLNIMWKNFLPKGATKDHMASNPVAPTHPSLKNLPSTLIQVGGSDCLRDRGLLYAEALKKEGVEVEVINYPNMIHCFPLFDVNVDTFLIDLAKFVNRLCQ